MGTERWDETYKCACGTGTITKNISEPDHCWSLASGRTVAWVINCQQCRAGWVTQPEGLVARGVMAELAAIRRAHAKARDALNVARQAIAVGIAADAPTPKTRKDELAYLEAHGLGGDSYASYCTRRRNTTWRQYLAQRLAWSVTVKSMAPAALVNAEVTADRALLEVTERIRTGMGVRIPYGELVALD